MRELNALKPIDYWDDESGRMVLDFSQNVAGYVHTKVQGNEGEKIKIEHSEILGPERFFDNRNYRGARAAAEYTLMGGSRELVTDVYLYGIPLCPSRVLFFC